MYDLIIVQFFFLQLIEKEHLFNKTDNEEHQQRRESLAQALLRSITKPNKDALTPVTVVTVAREAMLNFADYGVWQFFSARGMSGSKKMCMKISMPATYAMIRGTVVKTIDCSQKTADKAISNVLKNCGSRKGAKVYLERLKENNEPIDENSESMSPQTFCFPETYSKHVSRRPKSPPGNNHPDLEVSRRPESYDMERVSKRRTTTSPKPYQSPITLCPPEIYSKHVSRRPKSPPGNNHPDLEVSRRPESYDMERVSKRRTTTSPKPYQSPITLCPPEIYYKHVSRRAKSPPGDNHPDNVSRRPETYDTERVSRRTTTSPKPHQPEHIFEITTIPPKPYQSEYKSSDSSSGNITRKHISDPLSPDDCPDELTEQENMSWLDD